MALSFKTGRERDIAEIVRAKRALVVGRLLLGDLDGLERVFPDDFSTWTRQRLKQLQKQIRLQLKGKIAGFCQENFAGATESKLAELYEPLWEHGGTWRLPLAEFQKRLGVPKPGVLRGAPLHATVCISPWGLQTEFPEMHLCKDLAEAVDGLIGAQADFDRIQSERLSWNDAKRGRGKIAPVQRRILFNSRMALIAAFNLVEAFVNGLAWECLQSSRGAKLSDKERAFLAEDPRPVNLVEKLKKVPRIVTRATEGPLHDSRDPLKEFLETVKPFRDAIVHASPFSAPEKFGGYDKLEKIYLLDSRTALRGVDVVLEIIGQIHRFVGGKGQMPQWLPPRDDHKRFIVEI